MIYLENIEVLKEHNGNLTEGLKIECKQINLLVGDQGCGKSSLLNLLKNNGCDMYGEQHLNLTLTEDVLVNGVETFYFDSEKMNPRISDLDNYTNPNGTSKGIGVGGALSTYFMSHGEALKTFTVDLIKKGKNSILFVDEPEAALSVRNQFELVKSIKKAAKNGCQLFIATHCFPLIDKIGEVYSLEHKQWMTSKEFIKTQK